MKTSATPRPRQLAQLDPATTLLRRAVAAWGLANGRRVDFDALTVILATKAEDASTPVNRWTEDDVWRLWWIDLSGWCSRRGLRTPDGLATTMLTLFAYLAETGQLCIGSDAFEELEGAMEGAGALWRGPKTVPAG